MRWRETVGKQTFSDTLADRPVGNGCAIGGRNPPLSHQSVLILSAYAYQEGVSLVLANAIDNDKYAVKITIFIPSRPLTPGPMLTPRNTISFEPSSQVLAWGLFVVPQLSGARFIRVACMIAPTST